MLTHSSSNIKKRKDKPWLIIVICFVWVLGTAIFHSAWEPYEPFVLAVIKNIINTNSWFTPYISGVPYLDIQPFYFWVFSIFIKIFNTNALETMRIINSSMIFLALFLVSKVGSRLYAYKNGRTVALILISSVGFINYTYQISPLIVPFIGVALVFYSIQNYARFVSRAIILLGVGFSLISFNFNGVWLINIFVSMIIAMLLVKKLKNKVFYLVYLVGFILFTFVLLLYIYQLYSVNSLFLEQWWMNYSNITHFRVERLLSSTQFTLVTLLWFNIPQVFLVIWTLYKRRLRVFADPILSFSIIFLLVSLIFNILSCREDQNILLTSVIPMTLLASVEVDSIKITIVAWLKWFSISVFGLLIASLWLVYIALFCNVFPELSQTIYMYTQNFVHRFHPVLFLLAVTITVIWFTLISRRHIRGREMITNYACGMTCVIILFECLYLPIVDSSLDFKHMVRESQPFISNNSCVATNENNNIQSAVWYYYANTSLIPVNNINKSGCNQAIVANNTKRLVDYTESWNVVWQYQRPVDKMNGRFYMLLNKKESL